MPDGCCPGSTRPWQTVYYHFWKWRRDGRLRRAHDRLRESVREVEERDRNPSGAVIDSQAVKGAGVGGPERGYDGGKRLSGRKRHLLVDTGGLVLGAHVHAASLHDRDGAQQNHLQNLCFLVRKDTWTWTHRGREVSENPGVYVVGHGETDCGFGDVPRLTGITTSVVNPRDCNRGRRTLATIAGLQDDQL